MRREKRRRRRRLRCRPLFRLPTPENTDDFIEGTLAEVLSNYYIVKRKKKNWKR